jgi:hypothetical protein
MIRQLVEAAFKLHRAVIAEWGKLAEAEFQAKVAALPPGELEVQAISEAIADRRAAQAVLKERNAQAQRSKRRFQDASNGEAE